MTSTLYDTLKPIKSGSDSLKQITSTKAEKEYDTVEIIKAVGSIWPFLATVFVIIIVLIKWKTIWAKFDNTSKVKIAGHEVEFEKEKSKIEVDKTNVLNTPETSETVEKTATERPADLYSIYQNLRMSDSENAEKLFTELQRKTEDETEKQLNLIRFVNYKYLSGYSTALRELIDLKEKITIKDAVAHYHYVLGTIYSKSENYEDAIAEFNKSMSLQPDISRIQDISKAMYKSGRKAEAYDYLISQITKTDNREDKSKLFFYLSEHFESEKNNLKKALALEKAIEHNPNNLTWLFLAALSYSEVDLNLLALNHYLKRAQFDDDGGTSNNLGVTLSKVDLDFTSVEWYKKSFEQGESLAASNLAHLLIGRGFYEEAENYIKKALENPDVHKNVWGAKESLESSKKAETEKLEQIKASFPEQVLFLRKFGSKFFTEKRDAPKLSDPLKTSDGFLIEIKSANDLVSFLWKDNKDVNHNISFKLEGDAGFANYKFNKPGSYTFEDNKNFSTGFFQFELSSWTFLFYGYNTFVRLTMEKA